MSRPFGHRCSSLTGDAPKGRDRARSRGRGRGRGARRGRGGRGRGGRSDTPATTNPSENKSNVPQEAPGPNKRVFIRWNVDQVLLESIFSKFGKVEEARLAGTRLSSSFAFVTFENVADAEKAVQALQTQTITAPITVEFARTETRPPRRARAPRRRDESQDEQNPEN